MVLVVELFLLDTKVAGEVLQKCMFGKFLSCWQGLLRSCLCRARSYKYGEVLFELLGVLN
jgi:hypothetical protein